jgi:hypothetical protein
VLNKHQGGVRFYEEDKMKKLIIAAVFAFAVVCSKSPVSPDTPFTVCNTVANQNVEVSIGIVSGGVVIPQTSICIIYGIGCRPVDVPDGTIIVCTTNSGYFANIAHKNEYWNL